MLNRPKIRPFNTKPAESVRSPGISPPGSPLLADLNPGKPPGPGDFGDQQRGEEGERGGDPLQDRDDPGTTDGIPSSLVVFSP